MSKESRKNVAKEIRSSHFKLGGFGTDYDSAYKTNFSGREGGPQQLSQQALSEIRKSHFNLGTDTKSITTKSEAQQRFQRHNSAAAQLDSKIKADLRTHHFALGNDKANFQTHSSTQFTNVQKKVNPTDKKDVEVLREKIRKHNFHFGEKWLKGESIAKSDYIQKTVRAEEDNDAKLNLRKAHFQFGNEKPDYKTVSSTEFPSKKSQPATLNVAQLKDLRKEHFQHGTDKQNYQTQIKANHDWKGTTPRKQTKQDGIKLRETHFKLGSDVPRYSSTFTEKFQEHGKQNPPEYSDMINKIRQSNFTLGESRDKNYTSEASSRYQNHTTKSSQLSKETLKDLRTHHFGFGNDVPKMKSKASSDFKNRPTTQQPGSGDATRKLQDRIKSHHFDFGTSSAPKITQNRDDFRPLTTQAVEESQAKKDLRKQHFAFGNDTNNYTTTMKGAFNDKGSARREPCDNMTLKSHWPKGIDYPKSTSYGGNHTWKQPY